MNRCTSTQTTRTDVSFGAPVSLGKARQAPFHRLKIPLTPRQKCDGRSRLKMLPSLRSVAAHDITADAKGLGVSFTPLHEDFGADVSGLDLRDGISEAQGTLVKNALDRFTLLRFRQQDLEPADEAKFLSFLPHDEERLKSGDFSNPFPNTVPGYPWLAIRAFNMDLDDYYGLTAKGEPASRFFNSRLTWHMDLSNEECPAMYSYMYMKVVPRKGAETLFASTVKAYSILTDEQKQRAHKLQQRCYKREAMFRIYNGPNAESALCESGTRYENPTEVEEVAKNGDPDECFLQDFHGPFVIEEKGTGVRSINATPLKIHSFGGMSTEETHELLEEFLGPEAATAPERVWITNWQEGDIVVWKNRQIIHSSPPMGSYLEPRLFHLVFWESCEPVTSVENGS